MATFPEKVEIKVGDCSLDSKLLASYEATLRKDGVVKLESVFTENHLDELTAEFDETWHTVMDKIQDMHKLDGSYLNSGLPRRYSNQPYWQLEDGSLVLDLAKGRLDFTFGMDRGLFAESRLIRNPMVSALVWRLLKCDWTQYTGALPSFSNSLTDPSSSPMSVSPEDGTSSKLTKASDFGPWHRDTYSLFDGDLELQCPAFYLTLVLPLQEIHHDMGPTEFLIGSHRDNWNKSLENRKSFLATSKMGDGLLFDGRIIHRGTPCRSLQPRRAVYIVFHKKWYCDYIDGQFSKDISGTALPEPGLLPSGFQVDFTVTAPTINVPSWQFRAKRKMKKGDLVWTVGNGDSTLWNTTNSFWDYLSSLTLQEAAVVTKASYTLDCGNIVERRDIAAHVPNGPEGNIEVRRDGSWLAARDMDKDQIMTLKTLKMPKLLSSDIY